MRIFSLVSIFLIPAILFIRHDSNAASEVKPVMEATCAYPEGRPMDPKDESGRCYGYDPCTACSNCSSCNYCNSGGSCGICSSGKSSNYRKSSTGRNSGSRTNGNSTRGSNNTSTFYESADTRTIYLPASAIVSAETLNVRKGPGTAFEIVARLSAGDLVTVMEKAGEKWVKIEVAVWDGEMEIILEGYVFKGCNSKCRVF